LFIDIAGAYAERAELDVVRSGFGTPHAASNPHDAMASITQRANEHMEEIKPRAL
jgi:hypothetical protein